MLLDHNKKFDLHFECVFGCVRSEETSRNVVQSESSLCFYIVGWSNLLHDGISVRPGGGGLFFSRSPPKQKS